MRTDPRPLAVLLAGCALAAAALPLPAQAPAEPAAPAEEAPAAEVPAAADDLPRVEDVLFVEGSLPHVPTSNTLVTKLPLPLRETPASVGVVSAGLMREQGAQALGEALQNVSGVHVQSQSGVADLFLVRGFDSTSSGLVLTDGANEPEISFYQLYNVERVEVLKGPGGFLYGAFPTASTVNMVRKQPAPADFLELGVAAGSFGGREGTLDWNRERGGLAFRLNGLWRESDGHRDGKESRAAAVNPAFTWRPREGTRLNLNLEQLDNRYQPDAGLPVLYGPDGATLAPVDRRRGYESPFDRSEQDLSRLQVDFESVLSPRLTVRNKAYYRRLAWESDATLPAGVFPDGRGSLLLGRSLLLLDDTQEFLGNQLEALLTARTGAVTHQLLAGLEVARLADRFTLDVGLLPPIDLFAPVESARGPVFRLPGFSQAADARSLVVAPYLVDQIALSERLSLLAGARFDRFDYEDRATATEREEEELSPLLGVVWSPASAVSLYANAGRSFAPPSTLVVGERRPERSEQVEAGIKGELLAGRLQATLALYRLDRENMAIPDDSGITQQVGSQRSRGLELELAAEPRPGLRAFASYAYNDAELVRFQERVQVSLAPPLFLVFDRSGNVPAFAPRQIANLWLSRRFAGGLGLAAGGRYVSAQFIAEDNLFELPAYATLDGAVFWERGAQRWSLNLDNLTDEEYETRGFGGLSVIPAPGFSLRGAFSYRLGPSR